MKHQRAIPGGVVRFVAAKARSARVLIIKQQGLTIRVVQPWSDTRRLLTSQFNVMVTLSTVRPTAPLGGLLGSTVPQASGDITAAAGPFSSSLLSADA
jgi:outer membrane lipoprotein SlyB